MIGREEEEEEAAAEAVFGMIATGSKAFIVIHVLYP